MANPHLPEPQSTPEQESFSDILSQYEQSHSLATEDGCKQLIGTVIAVSSDSVVLDIGYKIEGILPLTAFQSTGETVKPGDKVPVNIKGRGPEGHDDLSRGKIRRASDWASPDTALPATSTIGRTVRAGGE